MKTDPRQISDDLNETHGEYPGIDLEVLERILLRRSRALGEDTDAQPLDETPLPARRFLIPDLALCRVLR